MRNTVLAVIFLTAVVGCAREASAPISPPLEGLSQAALAQEPNDCHRLYGEYTFFIDADHERVDVVPRREGRFHLNALKFLESYCKDCLKITNIKNNGDSTIDLTVQLTHPFKGYPEYTGFDVKGIIMFNGSYEIPDTGQFAPVPDPVTISWRETGDAEVLNPDGYSFRWYPGYDSGSSLPIFNYWEGKYATGTPNAQINAFLNFYSAENRHIFLVTDVISRTYKIYLPPGKPIVAGYAVEACWEPPTKMPVTDPVVDFPVSANQTEPYYFDVILNNGQPIKYFEGGHEGCEGMRAIAPEWDEAKIEVMHYKFHPGSGSNSWSEGVFPCGADYPDSYGMYSFDFIAISGHPPGTYRDVAWVWRELVGENADTAIDLIDYTIIE
jgi:hypothetical protein